MLMHRTVEVMSSQGPRRTNADAVLAAPDSFALADGVGDSPAAAHAALVAVQAAVAAAEDPLGAARAAVSSLPSGDAVLVVATRVGDGFAITRAGDVRAYHWDGQSLTQLTTDQTVAQYFRDRGLEVAPRMEHVVTNTVRHSTPVNAGHVMAGPGRLLLTSDGVHGRLPHDTIAAIVRGGDAAARLVRAALLAGGTDNATALVVDSTEGAVW